jgi:hypothetical protein
MDEHLIILLTMHFKYRDMDFLQLMKIAKYREWLYHPDNQETVNKMSLTELLNKADEIIKKIDYEYNRQH